MSYYECASFSNFLNISVFLCVSVADAAFPLISPSRLQFFEYDSISLKCEDVDGMTEWRAARKVKANVQSNGSSTCWMSAGSCTIDLAFERDSGEYWCEAEHGERSNAFNVSVTGTFVKFWRLGNYFEVTNLYSMFNLPFVCYLCQGGHVLIHVCLLVSRIT